MSKDYDAWEELLGHAALYLQECYKLSMNYIVQICRGMFCLYTSPN